MRIDLHTHSTASDGLNDPAQNVKLAKEAGLAGIGVTDHDTVNGVEEALKTGEALGIEIIPGIEMSTVNKGQDIHVLGYFIDYRDKEFLTTLEGLQQVRDKRNRMMIAKLNDLGIEITMEEATSKLRREHAHVGRPHIGEVLMEKGIVKTMEEAFEQYLGKEGKAYVNPKRISPEEGIDIIRKAGGVAVLAHPGLYDDDELVVRLIKYGLVGIEAYHPDHDKASEARYQQMVEEYGVLATAGSDFHGARGEEMFHGPIGTKTVAYEVIKKMKELATNKQIKK